MTDRKTKVTIIVIVILTLLFVLFLYLKFKLSSKSATFQNNSIYLNLESDTINNITAFDIRVDTYGVNFDSVELGEGYEDYVKIVWDVENGHFAAFTNPNRESENGKQTNRILFFESDDENNKSSNVEISSDSLIYIKNKGEFYLKWRKT